MPNDFARSLSGLVGEWGAPRDYVAWSAFVLGLALLVRSFFVSHRVQLPISRRLFVTLAAVSAAALSIGYIHYYLRGGPRIIDATTYYLQGRAISEGHLTWTVPSPTASFRGRFLLFQEAFTSVAGIFPPGFPALLALGFKLRAPLAVGPVLASIIAVLTYFLTRELAFAFDLKERELAGRTATALSVLCATLRYHTADTMAHATCALCLGVALTAALRAVRLQKTQWLIPSGFAVGYIAATRLASAPAVFLVVLALSWQLELRRRGIALFAFAMVPGLALLAIAQKAATGSYFGSTQLAYYATSDGPPGCFRYGFGHSIGCLFEHGDFVRSRLSNGYSCIAAIGTTLRRLRMHLTDVANFEPLALLALAPAMPRFRLTNARVALLLVAGHIAAYVPFYFDGNYPGGGARLYADILPIEHALLGIATCILFRGIRIARRAFGILALSCIGFAIHSSNDHRALASRDGGKPMFDARLLEQSGMHRGLLFVDTDHGFNLAHDPDAIASSSIVVGRYRGDDHDRLLWERLGRPLSQLYQFGDGTPMLTPWSALPDESTWTFESEAEWPPLSQTDGWIEPVWLSEACASKARGLALRTSRRHASATLSLPVPRAGMWEIIPRIVRRGGTAHGHLAIVSSLAPTRELASWDWSDNDGDTCEELSPSKIELDRNDVRLVLDVSNNSDSMDIVLDRTMLRWLSPSLSR